MSVRKRRYDFRNLKREGFKDCGPNPVRNSCLGQGPQGLPSAPLKARRKDAWEAQSQELILKECYIKATEKRKKENYK